MPGDLYQLPMFPLGRAALPGETVPLRIFEPRYLEMLDAVEAGSGEFGIVLISRGWEVGGGEERFTIATACRVVRDVPLGETQRAIVALAGRRLEVVEWLDDDPFPRAAVVDVVDDPADHDPEVAAMLPRVRRLYALASELGADIGAVELAPVDDSPAGLWRLASLVPLGEFDRQRLLETRDVASRRTLLGELIDDAVEELRLRLAGG